ncbi:hypothetical protein NBRC10512_006094 [Rhodotorula toruloides]|uniref:RHTO0S10e01002g1_1 n=2 Tax=Rhodotorula toruloides TaxID=5286 RepID=A0A061B4R6_RHOTO|nr:uncharacterized protein RHTO_05828 [Rhodotorula toruloides NP11]EMS18576.1 hypothetical protein RHTO_05828 [Rhodotorula toruloides NP11]CDR44809.1 RHTO0S10e01002g1_1 [Rhodotorula toruloides]
MSSDAADRVNLLNVSIDPASPATHSQQVCLFVDPFSSGSWTIDFEPVVWEPGLFRPSKVSLRWRGCRSDRKREVRMAVRVGNETHALVDWVGGSNGTWTLAVGRPSKILEIAIEVAKDEQDGSLSPLARSLNLIDQPPMFDLCLAFARDRRRLWASSAVLAQVSPWWAEQMQTSGFREESITLAPTPAERSEWHDSDCSDDEAGAGPSCLSHLDSPFATPPPSPPIRTQDLPPFCRIVPIHGTSYRTYRAFLGWVFTGTVHFAPLTSSFRYSPIAASHISTSATSCYRQHAASLAAHRKLYPNRPTPVSPKSLYRLAHFLEIPSLQRLCLDALKGRLTMANVAYELFTDPLAEVYPEVFDLELEFAREGWDEVKQSQAMRDVTDRMREEGATQYELSTLFRLTGL